jgi:hypothetical protein
MSKKSQSGQMCLAQKEETSVEGKDMLPSGWEVWGPDSAKFKIFVDENCSFNGQPAVSICSSENQKNSDIWLFQYLDVSGYKGKRIRWTGYIKTRELNRHAVLWLDVLGSNNARLAMDNMADRQLQDTTDWTKCVLVLDVPQEALFIRLACSLTGEGTAWFSGFEFEVVDKTVSKTDTYALGCRGIWLNEPINIDLSEKEDNESYAGDDWPGLLPKGWLRWGAPEGGYEIGMDFQVFHINKNSGTIKALAARDGAGFGSCFQKFGAPPYRGKRVRFSGYTKTLGVTGHCGLVMRVLDIYSGDLAVENTYDMGGTGTNEWAKREIVMDVPEHAGVLSIGASLYGEGHMWFDGLVFEEVGLDVPLTISEYSDAPQNLNFQLLETKS